MDLAVDTNVPVAANGDASHASGECVDKCVGWIDEIFQDKHIICLDDDWHILQEYSAQLRSEGQPGVGDGFLRWVLVNRTNPARCKLVSITFQDIFGQSPFSEFPTDPALAGFDRDDHKFAAVALAHQPGALVLNATDRDWWEYRKPLKANGVQIEFLCLDDLVGR